MSQLLIFIDVFVSSTTGSEVICHLFSAPEPKAQVHYCDHTLSVCRLSGVNFSHFRLLLWNHWTEFKRNLTGSKNSTSSTKFVFFGSIGKTRWLPWPLIGWDIFDLSSETSERNSKELDRKQDLNILYQVCDFRAHRKNKMAALASDWLRHFPLLLWNRWMEFNATWQEARSQCPLPSLCFSGRSKKQDGGPGLWLAETFSTSPLKPLNRILRNLTGSKIWTSSTKFVFFQADLKNKMAALASDWLRHFQLLLWNRLTEFNETWQEARSQRPLPSLYFSGRSKKQDGWPGLWLAETFSSSPLKPLNGIQRNLTGSKISMSSTKFVFFGLIGKNKLATLASDWLGHFGLLLWIRWTEFNETWQEARSQFPLPSLYFSGRSEKQDGCPGLWLADFFFTSILKPLNGIQQNLTGCKISTSSTKFVFLGPISKQKCPPWPIPQKGGTLYSGARYVTLLASCFDTHWNCAKEKKMQIKLLGMNRFQGIGGEEIHRSF